MIMVPAVYFSILLLAFHQETRLRCGATYLALVPCPWSLYQSGIGLAER